MTRKSVSSLEYQRVYDGPGSAHLERITPKLHLSKKERRKLRAQRSADTLKWLENGEKRNDSEHDLVTKADLVAWDEKQVMLEEAVLNQLVYVGEPSGLEGLVSKKGGHTNGSKKDSST